VALIVAVAAALLRQRLLQGGRRYEISAGKSMRPLRVGLGAWRLPFVLFSWLFLAVAILMPAAVIFLVAGLKAYGLPPAWENLTLANFSYVLFQWEMTREAVRNGLLLSLSAAAITLAVGTMIAYVIVKTRARGRAALEMLALLPYAIPGTVLAIGVILAWSGGWGLNLYNTLWIILVAYIARYMAFAVKSVAASLEQIHPSLEEAARASGGTRLDALKDVVLPLIRPGMVAGFLLIFLPAIRELTVSVLLYGPGTRTIGVATYSLLEEGYTVYAAAMAAVTLAIMMAGNLLLRWLGRERRPRS
jgi:iron(III) transport system permease protein